MQPTCQPAEESSVGRRSEEDRGPQAVRVLRPEALEVVVAGDVDPSRPAGRVRQRCVCVVAALDRDHAPGDAVADEVDRDVGEGDGDGLVERVRVAAAQVVGELARERLFAGALADLRREVSATFALCLCPNASGGPYSAIVPPFQWAPSAAMTKA